MPIASLVPMLIVAAAVVGGGGGSRLIPSGGVTAKEREAVDSILLTPTPEKYEDADGRVWTPCSDWFLGKNIPKWPAGVWPGQVPYLYKPKDSADWLACIAGYMVYRGPLAKAASVTFTNERVTVDVTRKLAARRLVIREYAAARMAMLGRPNESTGCDKGLKQPPDPKPDPKPQPPDDEPPVLCEVDLGDYVLSGTLGDARASWDFTGSNVAELFSQSRPMNKAPDPGGVVYGGAFNELLRQRLGADMFVKWTRACASAAILAMSGKLDSPFKLCWGAQSVPAGVTPTERAMVIFAGCAAERIASAKPGDLGYTEFKAARDASYQGTNGVTETGADYAARFSKWAPEDWLVGGQLDTWWETSAHLVNKGEKVKAFDGLGKSDNFIGVIEALQLVTVIGARRFAVSHLLDLA